MVTVGTHNGTADVVETGTKESRLKYDTKEMCLKHYTKEACLNLK